MCWCLSICNGISVYPWSPLYIGNDSNTAFGMSSSSFVYLYRHFKSVIQYVGLGVAPWMVFLCKNIKGLLLRKLYAIVVIIWNNWLPKPPFNRQVIISFEDTYVERFGVCLYVFFENNKFRKIRLTHVKIQLKDSTISLL